MQQRHWHPRTRVKIALNIQGAGNILFRLRGCVDRLVVPFGIWTIAGVCSKRVFAAPQWRCCWVPFDDAWASLVSVTSSPASASISCSSRDPPRISGSILCRRRRYILLLFLSLISLSSSSRRSWSPSHTHCHSPLPSTCTLVLARFVEICRYNCTSLTYCAEVVVSLDTSWACMTWWNHPHECLPADRSVTSSLLQVEQCWRYELL